MNTPTQKISNGVNGQIIKSTGCCEPFNPEPWQEKEIVWQDNFCKRPCDELFSHSS